MSEPHSEKAESDTEADDKVAGSRADSETDDPSDGPYVGRTFKDDDLDTEESGAEARAQQD